MSRCPDCPRAPVVGARAPFAFEGPARRAIHRLKFSGWRGVAGAMAGAMAAVAPTQVWDAITWVPLARRRLAERGFDQARALAEAVGREMGTPCVRLLRRRAWTEPQARRGGAERRTALAGAFEPLPRAGHAALARVLLVDDVLTTGATAAACADALMAAGTREVHLLTAARAFQPSAYTRPGSRPGLWLPGGAPR